MQVKITDRGFARADFEDCYGSQCSVQESSLGTEAAIWLGVDKDWNGDEHFRMHLTQQMVASLLPLLQHFAEYGELPR